MNYYDKALQWSDEVAMDYENYHLLISSLGKFNDLDEVALEDYLLRLVSHLCIKPQNITLDHFFHGDGVNLCYDAYRLPRGTLFYDPKKSHFVGYYTTFGGRQAFVVTHTDNEYTTTVLKDITTSWLKAPKLTKVGDVVSV